MVNDYPLTQDRECASYNKLCAMSNTHQWEGKYYCPNEKCWPKEYFNLYTLIDDDDLPF